MPKSPELGSSEDEPKQESVSSENESEVIKELSVEERMKERMKKDLEIIEKRKQAFLEEKQRLDEIRKTRRLTEEEMEGFTKLSRMGPLPEEKK